MVIVCNLLDRALPTKKEEGEKLHGTLRARPRQFRGVIPTKHLAEIDEAAK